MRYKLKVVDIEKACQCPFYMSDKNNKSQCIIKLTTTPSSLVSQLEDDAHSDFDYWDMDCKGVWQNCSILPLLYKFKEEDEQESKADDSLTNKNKDAVEEYDPFNDSENPDDYSEEPEAPVIVPAPEKINKNVELESFNTKFSIHKVENPYLVKADVLVYPSNNQLYIDDLELRKMLKNSINVELANYLSKSIEMGKIYPTTNGGKTSTVKAKNIYHAVVAGTSRLVNEADVSNATFNSLVRASLEGREYVVLMPADCGTLDIYATAMNQIGAVKQYLMSDKNTNIKEIFMVMRDEESFNVFTKYHIRIFKKRKKAINQA